MTEAKSIFLLHLFNSAYETATMAAKETTTNWVLFDEGLQGMIDEANPGGDGVVTAGKFMRIIKKMNLV